MVVIQYDWMVVLDIVLISWDLWGVEMPALMCEIENSSVGGCIACVPHGSVWQVSCYFEISIHFTGFRI